MKLYLAAVALLLAACSPPAARVDTQGQAARAEVDDATRLYGECVSGHADALPVNGDAAGSIALEILKTCKASRTDLVAKVARFHKLGNPKESDARAEAVAEASVMEIDDQVRQAAVVTIIKRQSTAPGETQGTKI